MKFKCGSFGGFGMYDKVKYNNEYNDTHYQRVTITVALGTKDTLKQMADDYGKSMAAFVMDAVRTKYAGEWEALQVFDAS